MDLRGKWEGDDGAGAGGLFGSCGSSSPSIPAGLLLSSVDTQTPHARLALVHLPGGAGPGSLIRPRSSGLGHAIPGGDTSTPPAPPAGPPPSRVASAQLVNLFLPRPDILRVCGCLVAVSSTCAPAFMQLFQVTVDGLQPLLSLALRLPPGLSDPARCRIRGLALQPDPSKHGHLQAVVLVGQLAVAPPGAQITLLTRTGAAAAAPMLEPLMCCTYRLAWLRGTGAGAGLGGVSLPTHAGAEAATTPHDVLLAGSSLIAGLGSGGGDPAASGTERPTSSSSQPGLAPAPVPPGLVEAVSSQLLGALSGMLQGLQTHMDSRLNGIEMQLQQQQQQLDALKKRPAAGEAGPAAGEGLPL